MIRLMLWYLLGIGVWLCQTSVSAQDAPTLPGTTEKSSEPVLRQVPPIILVDANGNPRLHIIGDWSTTVVDDFQRFLLGREQDPIPSFIIRSVSATGSVSGNFVEAVIRIELITSSSQTVRIPLGFKEGILPNEDQTKVPPFSYIGSGTALLITDPQERQYVAIVTPRTPQTGESAEPEKSEKSETVSHVISLVLWFPLTSNGGDEKRLPLSFPQSNSVKFLLTVPMTNVDASVVRGVLFDKQENAEQQLTLLQIQGLRTDSEITWKKREIGIVDDRPELLVERAMIDVRLDAQSTVYDAVLPVSCATGSFDQLQIRLPQGSVLDRDMTDRYAATSNYTVGDTNNESVITVRFPQKTTGPVSIHLRTEQKFEGAAPDFRRDLTGFEVLGAERQAGVLTVSVLPTELKPHWEQVRGIRRLEGSGTSIDSTGGTRFEFISQPFLLTVQAATPQVQTNVKQDYQFRISRGVITMNARLSYTVSGSRTNVVYLRLPDSKWHWEFEPSSNVETNSVTLDESGVLKIPLRSSAEGSFNIDFRAYQAIDAEDEQRHQLVLSIPRPLQVTWSEPATVTIVSAHNVEVLPSEEETRGLTHQSRRSWLPLRVDTTDVQQEAFSYRAELPDAVFVADLVFHQRKISATMQTNVQLFEEQNQVTQTIFYYASFGLVNQVYVLVPRTLDRSSEVQVRLSNRTTLELRDTTAVSQISVPDNYVLKMVQLPDPMFQFTLTFQYPPPSIVIADDETVPFVLPLICPTEVPVTNHTIHFFTPPGYKVLLQPESKRLWEPFRELRLPSPNVTEAFQSTQSPQRISLFVFAAERSVSGTTIVERAWIQTWLAGTLRVDRATYLLRSTSDSVTLQLPPDSMREHPVAIQVDHQPILQPNISPTGLLTIPISSEQYNRPLNVSVEYRYTFEMSAIEVSVVLPAFTGAALEQYEFWQVILQPNMHIVGSPTGWTLEYDWSWNGLFWWRVPSVRKSDIGFDPDPQPTAAAISGASQYVFSHLQPPQHVTLYIVNRSLILLASSGAALFIGLILIYVPQTRYAGSLFGLGVVLLAVLFYQPPLVLLSLQAATFGVFLALGTGYVYRIFHHHKQWVPLAFPMGEDQSQNYPTPVPHSQMVHEVVIDESGSKEPSVINPRNGFSPDG